MAPVLFAQCDCEEVSAKEAKCWSEVVFRGTVERFRGSGNDRVVIFRVMRVWKGRVGERFEMPGIESSAWCYGFLPGLLTVGNDVIVYAARIEGGTTNEYFPSHCQTNLVARSWSFRQLARGHKPEP
jgi:hypothetical protein